MQQGGEQRGGGCKHANSLMFFTPVNFKLESCHSFPNEDNVNSLKGEFQQFRHTSQSGYYYKIYRFFLS